MVLAFSTPRHNYALTVKHNNDLIPAPPYLLTTAAAAAPPALPHTVPGLPSLEPLMCLVCAVALRVGSSRPRLVARYLQRGEGGTGTGRRETGRVGHGCRALQGRGDQLCQTGLLCIAWR
jgi:hypothetical protein